MVTKFFFFHFVGIGSPMAKNDGFGLWSNKASFSFHNMESFFCIYRIFLSYANVEMGVIICHMKLVCRKLN
jgi:hypothetical protein